jgi:hypothetical protein
VRGLVHQFVPELKAILPVLRLDAIPTESTAKVACAQGAGKLHMTAYTLQRIFPIKIVVPDGGCHLDVLRFGST